MPTSSTRMPLTRRTITSRRVTPYNRDTLITFRVEKQYFKCQRNLLINASSVFAVMLNGNFAQPKVFVISSVSPASFGILITAISEDAFQKTIVQTMTNIWLAVDALHTAHMYQVMKLEIYLLKYIVRRIDWTNVLEVMEHANALNMKKMISKCWSVIEKFTSKVITTSAFQKISWDFLVDILENNRLTVKELLLVKAVYKWCMYQRQTNAVNKSKSIRDIIGVAIYKIRFPLLTRGEFQMVESFGMLAKGELEDLKSKLRFNETFPNRTRRNICECTNKHVSCTMCTTNDKLSSIRSKFFVNSVQLPIAELPPLCDCQKYQSCPNYPNGMSV